MKWSLFFRSCWLTQVGRGFTWRRSLILGLIIYLGMVIWPLKGLLSPAHWWGGTLIIFNNDLEARPCGGFTTAVGWLELPILRFEFDNVYRFGESLGPAPFPIDRVSRDWYLWDKGVSSHRDLCAQDFAQAYQRLTDRTPRRVLQIQASLLPDWLAVVGQTQWQGTFLDEFNVLPTVSRLVADVDHHHEVELSQRKNPLKILAKNLALKTILQPHRWRNFTVMMKEAFEQQQLFLSSLSQSGRPSESLSVVEWNLGGGKSSAFLNKRFVVRFFEKQPGDWQRLVRLEVEHLGMTDQPLSQVWKGQFEIQNGDNSRFVPAVIGSGETWEYEFSELLSGLPEALTLWTPPQQNWLTDWAISPFPAQWLAGETRFVGFVPISGKTFVLASKLIPDQQPPFLVIHKPIGWEQFADKIQTIAPGDFLVEARFNELIDSENINDWQVRLWDQDIENSQTAHPFFKRAWLLPDKQTVILVFQTEIWQQHERFSLEISGVRDLWKNQANINNRTVITRAETGFKPQVPIAK